MVRKFFTVLIDTTKPAAEKIMPVVNEKGRIRLFRDAMTASTYVTLWVTQRALPPSIQYTVREIIVPDEDGHKLGMTAEYFLQAGKSQPEILGGIDIAAFKRVAVSFGGTPIQYTPRSRKITVRR